ncbi:unnamed protein product [Caenorhabditis nigoni]
MVHEHLQHDKDHKVLATYEFLKRSTFQEAHRNICEMLAWDPVTQNRPRMDSSFMTKIMTTFPRKGTDALGEPQERIEECTEYDSDERTFRPKPCRQYFDVDFPLSKVETVYEEIHRTNFGHKRLTSKESILKNADILERFSLMDASTNYSNLIQNLPFPIHTLIVGRAYGKVKTLMIHSEDDDEREKRKREDVRIEYWRCRKGTTLIWRNYDAKFNRFNKYQQCASSELFHCLRHSKIDTLVFRTEKWNEYDPEIEPFISYYEQLYNSFENPDISISVRNLEVELDWFADSLDNERQTRMMLEITDKDVIEKIKFRKYTWSGFTGTMVTSERMGASELRHWDTAKELDIQDLQIHLKISTYVQFDVVRIFLMSENVFQYSKEIMEHLKNQITIAVGPNFDFEQAGQVLTRNQVTEMEMNLHENEETENAQENVPENAQLLPRRDEMRPTNVYFMYNNEWMLLIKFFATREEIVYKKYRKEDNSFFENLYC